MIFNKYRSNYEIVSIKPNSVTIRDLCGLKSVTNDAENVVRDLGNLIKDRRLYYYDTDNNLDELVHDNNGNFVGFSIIDIDA